MNLWALFAAVLLVLLILAFVMILQRRYQPDTETEVIVYEEDWPWWWSPGWYGTGWDGITVVGSGGGWWPRHLWKGRHSPLGGGSRPGHSPLGGGSPLGGHSHVGGGGRR